MNGNIRVLPGSTPKADAVLVISSPIVTELDISALGRHEYFTHCPIRSGSVSYFSKDSANPNWLTRWNESLLVFAKELQIRPIIVFENKNFQIRRALI